MNTGKYFGKIEIVFGALCVLSLAVFDGLVDGWRCRKNASGNHKLRLLLEFRLSDRQYCKNLFFLHCHVDGVFYLCQ